MWGINNSTRPIILIGTDDRHDLIEDMQKKLSLVLLNEVQAEYNPQKYFTDKAPNIKLIESLRGKHVYVITDPNSNDANAAWYVSSINDRYMYARAITKTAKDFGAKTTNQIFTTFPYARDDKYDDVWNNKNTTRKPNLANLAVEDAINDGNAYCITLDLHNPATFNRSKSTNFVNLGIGWIFEEIMKDIEKEDITISGCDEWSLKKIRAVAKDFKSPVLITLKQKDYSQEQQVDIISVYGNIEWRDIVLYDDMLDTGGTLMKTIEEIAKHKPNSVNIVVTHGLFNGDALDKIEKAYQKGLFRKLYITDTVKRKNLPNYIQTIETSTIFARTIESIVKEEGINFNNNEAFPELSPFYNSAMAKIGSLDPKTQIILPNNGLRVMKPVSDIRKELDAQTEHWLSLAKTIHMIG